MRAVPPFRHVCLPPRTRPAFDFRPCSPGWRAVVSVYHFFTLALWIVGVSTVLWPLTIPLAALAYKVRLGSKPVPFETGPFWTRCTFAALGLAVMSGLMIGVHYLFTGLMELPKGPI